MKLKDILTEVSREEHIENPFPGSLEKRVLFHGTKAKFSKFIRAAHGVYVTPIESWARMYYGSIIIPLYADVTKVYKPTIEREIAWFYNMEYEKVARLLQRLSAQGYNCCVFGGESQSMVLFNNVKMVHAITGQGL